jgi:myo-inositol-1(or 4)-monophosphatase
MSDDIATLVAHARTVASSAALLVMRGYRKRPPIDEKHPRDLVTEWDLASQEHILDSLRRLAPGVPVIAEEGAAEAPAALLDSLDACFIVDPIDGTTNFAHGHPVFCVSIGLFARGLPAGGAVVAPALGVEWTGQCAGGRVELWRNGEPACVSRTSVFSSALFATGFPPDRRVAPANNFDSFIRVKTNARAVRRCGSASLDLCFVADGTYDGYWERRLHLWDAAAGAAFVLAGGGRITALDGSPPRYELGHIAATNGFVHDELLRHVAADGPR